MSIYTYIHCRVGYVRGWCFSLRVRDNRQCTQQLKWKVTYYTVIHCIRRCIHKFGFMWQCESMQRSGPPPWSSVLTTVHYKIIPLQWATKRQLLYAVQIRPGSSDGRSVLQPGYSFKSGSSGIPLDTTKSWMQGWKET